MENIFEVGFTALGIIVELVPPKAGSHFRFLLNIEL
jgi:hypothetical protein